MNDSFVYDSLGVLVKQELVAYGGVVPVPQIGQDYSQEEGHQPQDYQGVEAVAFQQSGRESVEARYGRTRESPEEGQKSHQADHPGDKQVAGVGTCSQRYEQSPER